jgi:hypothetical protein
MSEPSEYSYYAVLGIASGLSLLIATAAGSDLEQLGIMAIIIIGLFSLGTLRQE